MKLSTVLLYSTIDHRWLDECLAAASKVSDEIVVCTCEKFWNGDPENEQLVFDSMSICQKYDNIKYITLPWEPGHPAFFFEVQCRTAGIMSTSLDTDYILFLDTDEIIEPDKFNQWINTEEYKEYDSMAIGNYWYFRDRNIRAKNFEDSPVLVRKDLVCRNGQIVIPVMPCGRDQYHMHLDCNKKSMILDPEGKPMVHHYSWVRTKDEMIQKVKSWGHNEDRDWISLIEEEFSRPFNGKCFVHNWEFEVLDNV